MFALYPRLKSFGTRGYELTPDQVQLLPARLADPLKWKRQRRVFVNSMSDLFHPDIPFEFVNKVFEAMSYAAIWNKHVFQVLTKRPGRAVGWWTEHGASFSRWHKNIWIGTSVENQKYAERLTVLSRLPAPVKFVSAEPLLDRLDLSSWLNAGDVQWLIVGGESGVGARKMHLDWVRDLRDQSVNAGVPFFLKQLGGVRDKRGGEAALVDGRAWHEFPK